MSSSPLSSLPSDALRDVYERRAELQYATPVARPDPRFDRKFERISELVLERLPVQSYLDVGCGDGRYLPLLADVAPPPARVAGTDISQRILETARATAAAAGIAPELVRANLESLPLEEGAFELVLCSQVIEHLLDVQAGIRELARVLAPGGTLILSTDNRANVVTRVLFAPWSLAVGLLGLRGRRAPVSFPERRFSTGELEELVVGTGLSIDQLGTFRFSPPPLGAGLFNRAAKQLLNRIDKRMSPHRYGDVLYVVASKPSPEGSTK